MTDWLGDPTNDAMVALFIIAVTLVPVCARITAIHARSRSGVRENRSHFLKAEGQRVRSVAGGVEKLDRRAQKRATIAHIREQRQHAIRRRRFFAVFLLISSAAIFILSLFTPIAWWGGLVPLAGELFVLVDGIISARSARTFEAAVRRSHTRAPHSSSSVTTTLTASALRARLQIAHHDDDAHHAAHKTVIHDSDSRKAADGPQSRPIRSVRQVARAVPLTGVARERVVKDVTPSHVLTAQPVHHSGMQGRSTAHVSEQASQVAHTVSKRESEQSSSTSDKSADVSQSQSSGESLSTNVSDILARRAA